MKMDNVEIGPLGRNQSGQRVCQKCLKSYNNRAIPEYCDGCKHYLGGKFKKKELNIQDAKMVTGSLSSVRTNKAGLATRTFVDLSLNKVYQI